MDCNDVYVNIDGICHSVHLLCHHDNYYYCWEWALHLDPLENLLEWLPFDSILKKNTNMKYIYGLIYGYIRLFMFDCLNAPHLVYFYMVLLPPLAPSTPIKFTFAARIAINYIYSVLLFFFGLSLCFPLVVLFYIYTHIKFLCTSNRFRFEWSWGFCMSSVLFLNFLCSRRRRRRRSRTVASLWNNSTTILKAPTSFHIQLCLINFNSHRIYQYRKPSWMLCVVAYAGMGKKPIPMHNTNVISIH